MANTSSSTNPSIALAMSLIEGHRRHINRQRGDVNNPATDFWLINTEYVVNNNRHRISKTAQEGLPNGDATTEGQSLMILGFAYAFLATKNYAYLELAEKFWNAYTKHFYVNQYVPETPQRWVCNWIVNGKEPVLAHYPLNTTEPTEGGSQGVSVAFTNGIGKIPAGAPTWGQYLDKATFAFVGVLGWNSIVASVYADNGSGGADYNTPGTKYPVDWIIAWTGDKIDSNGTVIGTGFTSVDHGTVKLQNTTLTGNYKLNYASRVPVGNGGYEIKRNEVQHNRPLHVPVNPSTVTFNRYRMSNAADAEEWFADACYVMWKITGEAKYKKALDSVLFTLREFAAITPPSPAGPDYAKFFMPSEGHTDMFELNNSYAFTYPSGVAVQYVYSGGVYEVYSPEKAEVTMESVLDTPVTINGSTYLAVTYGAGNDTEIPVYVTVRFGHKATSGSPIRYYELNVDPFGYGNVYENNIWLQYFHVSHDDNGYPWPMASLGRTDYYGGGVLSMYWTDDVGSNASQGWVVKCVFPDDDAGMIIDFADQAGGKYEPIGIVYRSDAEFDVRIVDDDGWRWYWIVPNTNGNWGWAEFVAGEAVLSGYQPGRNGRSNPSAPNYTTVPDFTIILENADTNKYFEYWCATYEPPNFNYDTGTVVEFRLVFDCAYDFLSRVGDVQLKSYVPVVAPALNYTPGIIPFSNIYDTQTGALDSTNGLPYPGYQYPMIWTLVAGDNAKLLKMIDFLYDAQVAYNTAIGQLGPVMSAYIWNLSTNTQYGPANTFTMYHWGTDKAWSGYQARAFQAGARALQELTYQDKTIPTKLTTFLTNWVNWLSTYYNQYQQFPTDFPSTSPAVPVANDFTGHMTGLWLAGLCLCQMGGLGNTALLRKLQDAAMKELVANYNVLSSGNALNGSWAASINLGNQGLSKLYGFWSGEILRGISLYTMLRNRNTKDLYHTFPLPPRDEYYNRVQFLMLGNVGGRPSAPTDEVNLTNAIRASGWSTPTTNPPFDLQGTLLLTLSGSNSGVLWDRSSVFANPRQFSVDFWVKSPTRTGVIATLGGLSGGAAAGFQFNWDGGQFINFGASSNNTSYDIGSITGTEGRLTALGVDTWMHIQVCQDDNNWYGFANGYLVWQRTYAGKDILNPVGVRGLLLGADYTGSWNTATFSNCMQGSIYGLRITAACRNKANFTPLMAPPPKA